MTTLERPKLRPLIASRLDHQGQPFALFQDPLGAFTSPVLVPLDAFMPICRHFDGQHTLSKIPARAQRETGLRLAAEVLERLVEHLDHAMVLDGPTFASFREAFRQSHQRPAALAGRFYARKDAALRAQLQGYFQAAGSAGPLAIGGSGQTRPNGGPGLSGRPRGVPSPHLDLCHVGPHFVDPHAAEGQLQETVRQCDGQMLDHVAAADPARWFQTAATVSNRWRVCGLAATCSMLHAIGPATGRLLRYGQALDDRRTGCVSFARRVFHTPEDPPGPECFSSHGHTTV